MLVWGDQDFLSLCTNAEESHVIHWIDITHDGTRLDSQVSDMVSDVLGSRGRGGLVSLSDDSALIVNDKESANTLVITDAVNALFEISHLFKI